MINRLNDYKIHDSVARKVYQKSIHALGYLSAMSEVAVRMAHAEYLMTYRGFDLKNAVHHTNIAIEL